MIMTWNLLSCHHRSQKPIPVGGRLRFLHGVHISSDGKRLPSWRDAMESRFPLRSREGSVRGLLVVQLEI